MKNKKLLIWILVAAVAVLTAGGIFLWNVLTPKNDRNLQIVLDGELAEGTDIEYTGQKIQFPVAYVGSEKGNIVSYNVLYKVVDLADQSEITDEYATFTLKTGNYQIVYTYAEDHSVTKTVSFRVVDTTAPALAFLEIPNGLFLQDITEDTINKLPLYSMSDASSGDGIDLKQVLKFKGEKDTDFQEYSFRKINNSYEISTFGVFQYELTATDIYGNTNSVSCQWKVKDRNWQPEQMPGEGILADYASEGYCNLVEGGDANQYYKIGNDYSDSWLAEFQGAQGVLRVDMGFNNAAGYGNNTIRLRVPKTFTQEDLEGKYLAVRMYVEGEHVKDTFLFGGNNVAFREEDSTTRAFTTGISGLQTGKWMTFYLAADTVEHIGMYPNASYNPDTTFYEGGEPADAIQLCFHREAGFFNNMVLYVDSIAIAEFLPDTELTVSGREASWTAVAGAVGYLVEINGEETVTAETKMTLPGEKGYIRVTPMGNGATTLNAQTVTGVYGLDAGGSIAKFDDKLYAELFNDRLSFSTDAEHNGYRAQSYTGTLTSEGLQMDIAAGSWGVVSGIRFQFPQAQEKGKNTTLILNMAVASPEFGQIRVYDYKGKQLGVIKLDETNTGKFYEFEIDLSAYKGKLEGIQFIFGPNSTFTSVNSGISITFKDIYLKNTYYPIKVNGQSLMCAGSRKLTAGYTNKDVVQFTTFYNFGVSRSDTPLGFSGTVKLDGKTLQSSAVTVVGYPDTDTICFKVPHNGKVLTIMKDSILYYGGIAVKVEETFNAKWNGSSWQMLSKIPAEPAAEYVTLADGSVKKVEEKVTLQAGYTNKDVVQFTNVYDFGVSENDTPLGFEGTVMLDGVVLQEPVVVGYPSNTTIALKTSHQGKLVTILKGAVIYQGDTAVVVTQTFNAVWDGNGWTYETEIPEPQEPEVTEPAEPTEPSEPADTVLRFEYRYGTANVIQVNTNLPVSTPVANFLATDNGCSIDQSANRYQQVGWIGMTNADGVIVLSFNFNGSFTAGQDYVLPAGAVFGFTDGSAYTLDMDYTFTFDGNGWAMTATEPAGPEETEPEVTEPEVTEPEENTLTFQYRYGTANVIQVNTNLPASTPVANFLATDNGCSIDQSGNQYQQIGWIQMHDPGETGGVVVLTFHFNSNFSAGQTYVLPAGAVFGFTDGNTYTLDMAYTFTFDGNGWAMTATEPAGPEETEPEITDPEVTEPESTEPVLNFAYRYGTANVIQVNTNLPVSTPVANFLVTDNGCSIDQSGNQYQQVGWIQMHDPGETGGVVVLTFHFNSNFSAGQTYVLPAGAVFGFTDGNTYTLDMDYTFTFDGNGWTMTATEPEETILTFQYRYGNNKLIQVNTNLPASTPVKDFLTTDNGCNIDQSGNLYQQIGWIGMENVNGILVLTFHFNSPFAAGQTYFLPIGAVFGFTDGSQYSLDRDYTFTFDGTSWQIM